MNKRIKLKQQGETKMKITIKKSIALAAMAIALALTGCKSDAKIASRNISEGADYFEILRRIVFYNGINGEYILTITGYCSIKKDGRDNQLEVICKTGDSDYKKHFLGISDNVTYFAEQLEGVDVSVNHYRIVFKPQTVIPELELRVDGSDILKDRH